MKKLTLTFCALIALFAAAPAIFADGPVDSGKKEVMQPAPPVCDFYRAHEWDLGIWGAYAFGGTTGQNNVPNEDPFVPDEDPNTTDIGTGFFGEQGADNPNERFNIGQVSKNMLFGRDDSWGGGVDVKYFWSKYFGVGLEGLGLAAKTNFAGGGVLTFTARYPWGRFAPYVTGGMGFIDGGSTEYKFFNEKNVIGTVSSGFLPNGAPDSRTGFVINEHEFWTVDPVSNHHIRALGQLGVGMEYRVTCHIGLMTDFTWNFVFGQDHSNKIGTFTEQGSDVTELFGTVVSSTPVINIANYLKPGQGSDDQNFGMVRFGVTFSY
jgi:hypothetical protein